MQKAPKVEFQLTSTQGDLFEQEAIILWMRINGCTVNAAYDINSFKDKESIRITLHAFIDVALRELNLKNESKCKKQKK